MGGPFWRRQEETVADMVSDRLVRSIAELTDLLQRDQTLGTNVARLAEVAVTSVPGCDAASVALSVEGSAATAAISARVALELDLVQYDAGEGPCLSSMERAETIRLDVVEQGDEMPHFAVGARQRGIRSVLSVPAVVRGRSVGTLNLYSRTHLFDESGETIAHLLAAQVAIAISRSPEMAIAQQVADAAQQESNDAADVAMATGLLMVDEDCTREQAEGLLRSASRHDERTILEVARQLITEQRRRP
jgi:GAF domain-containing protein